MRSGAAAGSADQAATSGQPAAVRVALIAAMAACMVALFAIPAARRVFALELPPPGLLAAEAAVVLVAISALSIWRARPHFEQK
jgi:hypothetical protein